jgi:hypothetical protein
MAALLKTHGVFYLSVPIGIERVEFNANRIFDPGTVVKSAAQHALILISLTVIRPGMRIETIALDEAQFTKLAGQRYALGIFEFQKRRGS